MIKIAEFIQSLMRIRHLSAAHMKNGKLGFIFFFVSYIIYISHRQLVSESDMSESDTSEGDMYESYIDRTKRKQGGNSDSMKVTDSQSDVNNSDDLFFSPITAKMARSIKHINVSGFDFCSILDHSLFNPWVHICILSILNASRA